MKVGQELADVGAGSGNAPPPVSIHACFVNHGSSLAFVGSDKSESKPKDSGDAPTAKAPVEDDKQKLEEKPISEEPMGGEPSPKQTSGASSSQPESSKPAESATSPAPKADNATPQPGADTSGPSIRFPPRMTPDGKRISDLPAEEQEKYRQQSASSAKQPQADQQAAPPQAAAKPAQKPSGSQPNKYMPYAGQDRGTKLSQARVLSAKEIEIIELGGADP